LRVLVRGGNPAAVTLATLLKNAGYNVVLDPCSRRFYGVNIFDCFTERHLELLGVEHQNVSEGRISCVTVDKDVDLTLPFETYVCRVTDTLERAASYNELEVIFAGKINWKAFDVVVDCRYADEGDIILSSHVECCKNESGKAFIKVDDNQVMFSIGFGKGLELQYHVAANNIHNEKTPPTFSYKQYRLKPEHQYINRMQLLLSPLGTASAEIAAAHLIFHKITRRNTALEEDILSFSAEFLKNTVIIGNKPNSVDFTRLWIDFLTR